MRVRWSATGAKSLRNDAEQMSAGTGARNALLWVHQRLYVASNGRIGHHLLGVSCLLLRSRGRRTGLERTNALVYARDEEALVIVASNGGNDRAPGWFYNLCAEPNAQVQIARTREAVRARVVGTKDPDYERLWVAVNAINRNRYDAYQELTSREIPLVVLTRLSLPGNSVPA